MTRIMSRLSAISLVTTSAGVAGLMAMAAAMPVALICLMRASGSSAKRQRETLDQGLVPGRKKLEKERNVRVAS